MIKLHSYLLVQKIMISMLQKHPLNMSRNQIKAYDILKDILLCFQCTLGIALLFPYPDSRCNKWLKHTRK